MKYDHDLGVTWQPSFSDWADVAPQALSKKERRRLKKTAKRARKQAQQQAFVRTIPTRTCDRQVRLDGAEGHGLRVIFCDFDGVLNQHRAGAYNLLRPLVERLDRLARDTGAVLVVSSWWRWIGVEALRSDLASAGFHGRLIGRTPWLGETPEWDARERGIEIQAVLDYLGERVETFVILDDHDRMGSLLPYLVQTDATAGLTEADAERARAILVPRPVALLEDVSPNRLTSGRAPSYTHRVAPDGALVCG